MRQANLSQDCYATLASIRGATAHLLLQNAIAQSAGNESQALSLLPILTSFLLVLPSY